MRVRAIAVPSERSNAIGAVELEVRPEGILLVLHAVGAYAEGYAPGALATGASVSVPWPLVEEIALEGDRLRLGLHRDATPHHQLLLGALCPADEAPPPERRRRRRLARIATGALALTAGLLAAATAAAIGRAPGAMAAMGAGALAAVVVLAAGAGLDRLLFPAPPDPREVALALAAELAAHHPVALRDAAPAAGPEVRLLAFARGLARLLPRTTLAVVVTLTATLTAAVLTATWVTRAPPTRADSPGRASPSPATPTPPPVAIVAPAATEQDAPAPPGTAATPGSPPEPAPPAAGRECRCARGSSPLWDSGLPRLSLLVLSRERRVRRERDFLELELAVVNNWERALPEVSLLVTFFAADPPPSGRRSRTTDRTLFFEGPLLPGQAIKWHVEGRGSDFEVEVPAREPLDPGGSDAAPTALAAELLRAHHRPVRLHGAMLLAYLGDPRGREGALTLRDAARDDEAPYLDRLLRATSPLRVCSLRPRGAPPRQRLEACVHNAGAGSIGGVSLVARALDAPFRHDTPVEAPPRVVAERSYELGLTLPPGGGAEVHVDLDVTNPDGLVPQAFEAYADPATPAPAGDR